MRVFLIILLSCAVFYSRAQQTLHIKVTAEQSNTPISATVLIKGTTRGYSTDSSGITTVSFKGKGAYILMVSAIGYEGKETKMIIPYSGDTLHIELEGETEELDEVQVISSTRSGRNIKNIPTRVETISAEELDEKATMQPGNIKMMLTESTGIQTQQTSQVSGSASIRIQGLDGKYTQLLQDGFPLYSGFAGGLSILQIPPLNLKRVEVIKGSASTLYGGGAIAGLVNLITKEPVDKREISFLVNVNQTGALDVNNFYSQKYGKTGLTIYSSGNIQKVYDANSDGFSDIPKITRYTINPKFFYYPNDKTTFSFGVDAALENRKGGDLQVVNDKVTREHSFFEANKSNRYSTQAQFAKTFAKQDVLTIKNSIGYFNRSIQRANYYFEGQQLATFSEVNFLLPGEKSEWNVGANVVSENFRQLNVVADKLDYANTAAGVFAQNSLRLGDKMITETGLRLDATNRSSVNVLPRLSILYKISNKLSSRVGGGLGYKAPTIFAEEAEDLAFENIKPLDFSKVHTEKSFGINADIDYKTKVFDDLNIGLNQMVFLTTISKPIVLVPGAANSYSFQNANGNIVSKGLETNLRLHLRAFSCFIGYTYIDSKTDFNNVSAVNPLTAKHRINANLMYEWKEKLRLSYELFYTGKQYLTNGEQVRDYWVMGFSGEYRFAHFSLFINFEDFLDARQSRWEPMYSGTITNPTFREVYTPTEGFIFNGGFKLNL